MNVIERLMQYLPFKLVIGPVFRFIDFIWPKDNNLVLFSSFHGKRYSDNSKFLFERLLEEHGDNLDLVWVSANRHIVDGSNHTPRGRFVYLYSIEGMKMLLHSRIVFDSSVSDYIPGIQFSRRTLTIQLWHGIPIKGIMGEDKVLNTRVPAIERAMGMRYLRMRYRYWISCSTIERNSIALCTGLPLERVVVTGYPRNDYLIEQLRSPTKYHEKLPPGKKIILYAPTYRPNNRTRFFPFDDFSVEELKSFLEDRDACMLLRAHHNDDINRLHGEIDFGHFRGNRIIVVNRDTIGEVQEILPYVDILISDYSGVWVDFLLVDRPIIFVPYDIESYKQEPGLLYDYDMITPGPKVDSFQEFLTAIDVSLGNPEIDSDRRMRIRDMFHKYDDGLAHERIFDLMRRHLEDGEHARRGKAGGQFGSGQ